MTAATKIHLPDPEGPAGKTLCGRKAKTERITGDVSVVTCDVCLVTNARSGGAAPGLTILDRLPAPSTSPMLDLARKPAPEGVDPARHAATEALIARHLDEFLTLYRDELARR